MRPFFLLALVIMLPAALAYDVEIRISRNDIVKETFNYSIPDISQYDSFDFVTLAKPIAVDYQGNYSLEANGSQYVLHLYRNAAMGQGVQFMLIYNSLVERSGDEKIFRASFDSADRIRVILPEKHILSENPSTVPAPDRMTTDGQNIYLEWTGNPSIAVFYEGEGREFPYLLLLFPLAGIAAIYIAMRASRKRIKDAYRDMLSEDENRVLGQVRSGVSKQSEIAKNLSFSKSKMSKVLRKLEEKHIIEKRPHFKTNIIKLKKI